MTTESTLPASPSVHSVEATIDGAISSSFHQRIFYQKSAILMGSTVLSVFVQVHGICDLMRCRST